VTRSAPAASTHTIADLDFLKVPTTDPADLSARELLTGSGYALAQLVAVVGKTEGNGCVNDFSRSLASLEQ